MVCSRPRGEKAMRTHELLFFTLFCSCATQPAASGPPAVPTPVAHGNAGAPPSGSPASDLTSRDLVLAEVRLGALPVVLKQLREFLDDLQPGAGAQLEPAMVLNLLQMGLGLPSL